MKVGIVEIVGLFLIVVGCGTVVGAAALVSVALAVLASGAFIILAGVLAVYIALAIEAKERADAPDSRTVGGQL